MENDNIEVLGKFLETRWFEAMHAATNARTDIDAAKASGIAQDQIAAAVLRLDDAERLKSAIMRQIEEFEDRLVLLDQI